MKKLIAMLLLGCTLMLAAGCTEAPSSAGFTDPPQLASPTASPAPTPEASAEPSPAITASPSPTPVPAPEAPESDASLVRVQDYIPGILVEARYASTDNFTGEVIYDYTDAYLRYGTVKKLATVQDELSSMGYTLKIWDAYRTVAAQKALWAVCPDARYVANPYTGSSSHNRGNTVDLTIVSADGGSIEMPSGFDDFSLKADRDYSDVSASAGENARLLESVMTAAGFRGYSAEWWHYSDTDSYDVLEDFPAGFGEIWTVECSELLSLRPEPDASKPALCTISNGESVELLGYSGCFARVRYNGRVGYVLSNHLTSVAGPEPDGKYGYDRLQSDIDRLCAQYPDKLRRESIGESAEGRELTVLILGDPGAKYQVLVQGNIHAREYVTSWLLIRQVEYLLQNSLDRVPNGTVASAMEDVCFHIIPMMNPDGVEISMSRTLGARQRAIYDADLKAGYVEPGDTAADYAAKWKANAGGTDLNRNFDAGWDGMKLRDAPSSELYKGTAPLSAPEARALADYTTGRDFDVTISYHAKGSVIYYRYGLDQQVIDASYSLGGAVAAVTGYGLPEHRDTTAPALDAGGYKDWAMSALGIPSLTIEVGVDECPLDETEYYSVFHRNRLVLPAVAQWIKTQK